PPRQADECTKPLGPQPAAGIRTAGDILAVLQELEIESHVTAPRVDDPELRDAGLRVERREALRVLADRAVTDDFDDHVRRTLDLRETVGFLAGGRKKADTPRRERFPE